MKRQSHPKALLKNETKGSRLEVLFVLPPCLPTPPIGYGGIEAVAAALLPELEKAGVRITLTTPIGSTVKVSEKHELTKPIYSILSHPYNEVVPHVEAYISKVMNLVHHRKFDVIHDFSGMVPILNTLGAPARTKYYPAVVHTMHGPIKPYVEVYQNLLGQHSKVTYTAISEAQLSDAPADVQVRSKVIYNGLNPEDYKLGEGGERLLVLGRLCSDKGQDRLAQYCSKIGMELDIAGTVAQMGTVEEIEAEIAQGDDSSVSSKTDFKFYRRMRHWIDGEIVKFHGNVSGQKKENLLGGSRAMAMPNRWAEPFGMVAIEAMASGTPVVGMNSGALPEIIKHGVTGYLADTWEEFCEYLKPEHIDKIDRAACRQHVIDNFSMSCLAQQYKHLYEEVSEK